MPPVRVLLYREGDEVPFREWVRRLPAKARLRCMRVLERLRAQGHEVRRPLADYLRDDIYELRFNVGGLRYRVLYFFHGTVAVVLSHGILKQRAVVPTAEIQRAIERRTRFREDPEAHFLWAEVDDDAP